MLNSFATFLYFRNMLQQSIVLFTKELFASPKVIDIDFYIHIFLLIFGDNQWLGIFSQPSC